MQFLEESFKGGKLNCFIKAFLFIRQSCLECSLDDYRSWYALIKNMVLILLEQFLGTLVHLEVTVLLKQ